MEEIIEIQLKFGEEEKKSIAEAKDKRGFLLTDIIYQDTRIGIIDLTYYNTINECGEVVGGYYRLVLKLGQNPHDKSIKCSSKVEYTLLKEEIDKVLYGEHILVNTTDGTRFIITIMEE